ncbi:hypothetical protein [Clostridium ganghwense]|uniref:DUF5082 domain-containing protein n=1 Tax=Clostridium ganghwense TaxID=312089 RepID=A0ABT4CMG6_9CLOT|nr:hypothetical protein [Clostridium ganghwense]MCY6370255.1 hypothetical protein [Clostridium ganghwense]
MENNTNNQNNTTPNNNDIIKRIEALENNYNNLNNEISMLEKNRLEVNESLKSFDKNLEKINSNMESIMSKLENPPLQTTNASANFSKGKTSISIEMHNPFRKLAVGILSGIYTVVDKTIETTSTMRENLEDIAAEAQYNNKKRRMNSAEQS